MLSLLTERNKLGIVLLEQGPMNQKPLQNNPNFKEVEFAPFIRGEQ